MRILCLLTFCTLAVVGIASAAGTMPDLLGLCGLDVASSRHAATRDRQRDEWVKECLKVSRNRSHFKRDVVVDLVAGRLTLLEAARLFKNSNEHPVMHQDNYRAHFPGASDGEKLCRQVLCWAEGELLELPASQAEAVQHRLDQELRDHLEQHGGVVVLTN
jgi:hypothetical protein